MGSGAVGGGGTTPPPVTTQVVQLYSPITYTSGAGSLEITNSDGEVVFQQLLTGSTTISFTPSFVDVYTVKLDQKTVLIATVTPPAGSFGFITGGGEFQTNQDGKSTFGFVAKVLGNGSVKGSLEYQAHGSDIRIKSSEVTSVWANTVTNQGYFSGTCSYNGSEGYTFRVYVADMGEPGWDDGMVVEVYSGNNMVYTSEGDGLDKGNIQIHG